MRLDFVTTPRDITRIAHDNPILARVPGADAEGPARNMTPADVAHVAEVFSTPLTGAYNWDYLEQDNRIRRLYALGKQLSWNAETDVPWSRTPNWPERPPVDDALRARVAANRKDSLFAGKPWYEAMDEDRLIELGRHMHAWTLSQFLHGEQGALLVASQLASCAPTYNAKLYAASQTFDEARHVEVFNTYLQTKVGFMYPISASLKALLDKILTDPRWDLKFIGMQIIIEGLALAAFNAMKNTEDPVLAHLIELVIRDEARHVTFGVNYLEEFVQLLSPEEREERARFAFEACVVMRERLIATDVYRHFGWPVEEARAISIGGPARQQFRNLIFSRVVPNLKRIGLLTDAIRPKFDELGLLAFETLPDDGLTSWESLAAPLYGTAGATGPAAAGQAAASPAA